MRRAVLSRVAAALVVPAAAYADTIRDCYGNPGSSGSVCLEIVREGGFTTEITATLVKRHADICSIPVLTFTVIDPTNGRPIGWTCLWMLGNAAAWDGSESGPVASSGSDLADLDLWLIEGAYEVIVARSTCGGWRRHRQVATVRESANHLVLGPFRTA